MIVSVDFDDTWTKDPEAWRAFARLMTGRGHTVIVTTNRFPIPGSQEEVYRTVATGAVADVIFAGAKPKRVAAAARGYDVDVWIDDSPEMVVFGLAVPPPRLCPCRRFHGSPRTLTGHRAGCAFAMVG